MSTRLPVVLALAAFCAASGALHAQNIAVYGATNLLHSFGSSVMTYDQAGNPVPEEMLFQFSPGANGAGTNGTIEDIAYDAAGNVYAIGKPENRATRAIYKSRPDRSYMAIAFEKDLPYDAGIDGSIAVSPT